MDNFELYPVGKILRMRLYGSSHGPHIGVEIEGFPPNVEVSLNDIQYEVDRRKPGQSLVTSQRKEEDKVEIVEGIIDGKTTGETIDLRILNKDVDLRPYKELEFKPRPGQADYPASIKYGDWNAYDRLGGRMTAGIVMAGAIAKKLLGKYNINIFGHSKEIAGIESTISYYRDFDLTKIEDYRKTRESNPVRCIDVERAKEMVEAILKAKEEEDSVGGVVEVIATGVPVGLGDPLQFYGLDATLSFAFENIPAAIRTEFGRPDRVRKRGSESNDPYCLENEKVYTSTNNCGGILRGISTGMPIVASVGFKPTPSITKPQKTVDLKKMEEIIIKIKGRHDTCIVPRAVSVVEGRMGIDLADHMLYEGKIPEKLP